MIRSLRNISLNSDLFVHTVLLGPLVLFLGVFFVYPLSRLLVQSVFDPEFTMQHYLMMVKHPVYLKVFWNTLEISITTTLITLLIAYPTAYYMNSSKSNWSMLLLFGILLPFWTSILVRTYAWMIILGRYGAINELLLNLGLIKEPLRLMYNRLGVYTGMVYVMIPFGVLPILSVMQGIDRSLVRAAENLGATPLQAFWNVFFPLSLPGVGAALLLTFIKCMGFFITPALMGGPRDTMIAVLIDVQLERIIDWGFASALSVVLLVIILILFYIYNRFLGLDMLWGGKSKYEATAKQGEAAGDKASVPGTTSRVYGLFWNEKRASTLETFLWGCKERFENIIASFFRICPKNIRNLNLGKLVIKSNCVLVFLFMMIPVAIIVPMGFSGDVLLRFPPGEWGLKLFNNFFTSEQWMASVWNSFRVATPVMFLATFLGTLASLSLVRGKYRGKQFWYGLILSPMIIPVIISAVALYFFFAELKLIGTTYGLILAHTALSVPYVVIVMTATLKGFDERLEQASLSLGAGRIRTFFSVTLPLVRPGILTALLFSFIISFDELVGAMFICGVNAVTLPKQMWDGIRQDINPVISAVAALLILLIFILMLVVIILRRRQEKIYT